MTSILIAFAIVTAIGLVAGVLLALAAHFLQPRHFSGSRVGTI